MKTNRGLTRNRLRGTGLIICGLVVGIVWLGAICRGQVGPSRAEQAQTWLEYGVGQAKQGDYQSAIEALKRAIAIDPTLQSAYYNLGLVLYQAGKPTQAARYFQEALKLTPTDLAAQKGLGLAYIAQGKYDRAAQLFQGLLRITPDDVTAKVQLGRCFLAQDKPRQAIPLLKAAAQSWPDEPQVHLYLGQALAAAEEVVDAEASLGRALKLRPDFEPAELTLLKLYVEAGRFMSAQPLVEKLLAKHPQDQDLLLAQVKVYEGLGLEHEKRKAQEALLAVLPPQEAAAGRKQLAAEYFSMGHYKQALDQLNKVRATRPGDAEIIEAIAQCYMQLGQVQRAVEVLEEGAGQGASVGVFVALGDAYASQAQYEKALRAYEQALKIDRGSAAALEGMVWVSGKLGRSAQMTQYLRRILAIVPASAQSRMRLADQLSLQGEWGETMQQYAAVAAEAPDDKLAMESLARLIVLAAQTGNRSFELHLRQQRQQVTPEEPDSRLIQLMNQQGDGEQTEQQVRQMLQKYPDNPDLKVARAARLMKAGQKQQAKAIVEEVLADQPGHGPANYLQAQMYMQQGEPSAAIGFLKRAILAQPSARRAYEELLTCAEATGQLPGATDFLTTVLADVISAEGSREDALKTVLLYLAAGYQRQGGAQRAAREVVGLSDAHPEVPILAVAAARTLVGADQITEAVRYYSRAARVPQYVAALVEATEVLLDSRPAAAAKPATQYLARVAGDGQAVAWVAALLGGGQSIEPDEKEAVRRLLHSQPGTAAYQFAKVDVAELLGQLAQAEAQLAAQAATEPQDTATAAAVAYALWRQGRPTEALARLDMAVARGEPAVQVLRATLLDELGHTEQAAEVVSEALVAAPSLPQASLLRAKLLVGTGAYQEALWEYCQVLTRDPTVEPAVDGVMNLVRQGHLELSTVLTALSQVYAVCPQPGAIRELVGSLGDQEIVHKWLAAHPQVRGQRSSGP